ncbi:MAG: homoserine dehydrogenase, partial [Brevinematales bacterium]|nr:homoserine dehydrogenase [Brevinematales bacterium]
DPAVEIIIELVGGTGFALQLVEESLRAGKHVVTANKALLAEKAGIVFGLRNEVGKVIGFEGSVAGGIPIIRTVTNALAADNITALYGIVNGTTNYILTKMSEEKMDFKTALGQAQELGFAEADPTLDIGGFDAAHKIAILGALAFNCPVPYQQVYVEGIDSVDLIDVSYAAQMGYVLKLIGIARIDADERVEFRVHPTLLPEKHQLAAIRNEYNAVMIESKYLGTSLYYGRGAGSRPTATAVLADIISIGRSLDNPERSAKYQNFNNYPVKPMGDVESRYYLRFNVRDQVGVLSGISGIFSEYSISISSVVQHETKTGDHVPLILTTHRAKESNILSALERIEKLEYSNGKGIMIRILD